MNNVAGPLGPRKGSSPGLTVLYDARGRRRIPQMSDFSAIREDYRVHGPTGLYP
jgi:hypothetical protein